ncbi:MAG: adenosylcobinamide-GDP ribazoletransferase [Cyanobacterium sp. T60_A2020_053]|nr:adenosylcobinamide-GDP ribazoletransferase [Cyanobacterium sp. T60_A2020_053]
MTNFFNSFCGALIFYTTIPCPNFISPDFQKIPRWLPYIGFIIAGFLVLAYQGLIFLGISPLTTSVVLGTLWLIITGGLHFDGVMDSADGLAVTNAEKRLQVMRDSVTGAFGVMAGIVVFFLKVASLSEMVDNTYLALILAPVWGRLAQLMAIGFYPYLRPEGKGFFLKESLQTPDFIFSFFSVIVLVLMQFYYFDQNWLWIILINFICFVIAGVTGAWFNYKLGGHTGDTYGATVEWTEALILVFLTAQS